MIPTNTILNKTLTGLGATHSEIHSKRNSIIIEPNVPDVYKRQTLVMMKSSVLRGFSFMTSALGWIDAKAMAAKVSMIRFTQIICVTVNGSSVPKKAPNKTLAKATTLIVS